MELFLSKDLKGSEVKSIAGICASINVLVRSHGEFVAENGHIGRPRQAIPFL
jgi:hypothetical protein